MSNPTTESSMGWRARRWLASLGAALLVIAVTIVFFAPHLWFMTEVRPDTYEWDRALGFLAQCANPWDGGVEAALRWRLLPPTLAYWLGLRGLTPLVIPWFGIIALLAYLHGTLRGKGLSRRASLATLFLVAGSGGVLAAMHWYGINDGWYLLGLAVVTLGSGWRSLVYPCLLCPWVDERFLIALPLALVCRTLSSPAFPAEASGTELVSRLKRVVWPCAVALVPYAIIRATLSLLDDDLSNREFLATVAREFVVWMPYAPLAWWMGLRAAWLPLFSGLRDVFTTCGRPAALLVLLLSLLMLTVSLVLAQDMSRTAILFLPGLLCGAISLARTSQGERILVGAAVANLLLPAMHVTSTSAEPIHFLPLELWRVLN
jgi:hypothetical protein